MLGVSKITDHVIGIGNGLYYHVQGGVAKYYFALFYDLIVYPTAGVIFSMLLPKNRSLGNLVLFNVAAIVLSTLFELLYLKPLKVIIYTGWRIIPHSLIFYSLFFPILTWYAILIKKKTDGK